MHSTSAPTDATGPIHTGCGPPGNAAEPAGLTKRKGTSCLNLRGEDMLRHAGLQTLDPEDPLPGEVDVKRHGEGE